MKRYIILFKGLPKGWVGSPNQYTITAEGVDEITAIATLSSKYDVDKIIRVRQLKG